MILKGNKITLSVNEEFDEATEKFLKIMIKIIESGLTSKVNQLHFLFLLFTGKSFGEKAFAKDEIIARTLEELASRLSVQKINDNISNFTIDDILG